MHVCASVTIYIYVCDIARPKNKTYDTRSPGARHAGRKIQRGTFPHGEQWKRKPGGKGSVGGVFWNYRLVMTYGLWTSPFFFQLKFRKSSFWSSGPFFIVNPGWLRIIGWASSESCCCSFFKRIIGKIRWWPWKLPRERERWFVLDPASFSLEHDDFHWTMFDYPKRHRQVGLQSTV